MNIGRLKITASRCPWQKVDPHWSHDGKAPERYGWGKLPGMGRFGGGWDYKLGLQIGGRTLILDWGFGSFRFVWERVA